jgi:hypothetical protein
LKPARLSTADRLHVHVGELRVPGVSQIQAERIGAAATRELARLLRQSTLPHALTHSAELARIDAGHLRVDLGSRPESIGQNLAQVIARALRRSAP